MGEAVGASPGDKGDGRARDGRGDDHVGIQKVYTPDDGSALGDTGRKRPCRGNAQVDVVVPCLCLPVLEGRVRGRKVENMKH